jgi:hypothetical protein
MFKKVGGQMKRRERDVEEMIKKKMLTKPVKGINGRRFILFFFRMTTFTVM